MPKSEAETKAYNLGYRVGRRRLARDVAGDRRHARDQALMDRLFLAVLPSALQAQGWTLNDEPVRTGDQRLELARVWAKRAFARRPLAP